MAQPELSKQPGRWFLPVLLLTAYAFLKFLGWHYAQGVQDLQRQLDEIRPILSDKVYAQQLQQTRLAYAEAIGQIQRLNLGGERLLETISQEMPSTISITRIDLRSRINLKILGNLRPGIRPPEEGLIAWVEKLQGSLAALRPAGNEAGFRLSVGSLYPSSQTEGLWHFELEVAEDA